jgi:hypothetical protein
MSIFFNVAHDFASTNMAKATLRRFLSLYVGNFPDA